MNTFSEVPQAALKPRRWSSVIGGLFTLLAIGVALWIAVNIFQ